MGFDFATGVRWEKTYRDVIGPLAQRFPREWRLEKNLQFSVSGTRRTVLLFRHSHEWPSVIVVLDDNGAVIVMQNCRRAILPCRLAFRALWRLTR